MEELEDYCLDSSEEECLQFHLEISDVNCKKEA